MRELRVALFGASNAGKTQSISRFLNHEFNTDYEPTIEERYTKELCIDGKSTSLKISDTQGLEQFRAMREIYINNADAFMSVYDTKEDGSLSELEDSCRQLIEMKTASCPFVVVGTKTDQLSSSSPNLCLKMGERLANRVGKPHIITSAKDGKRVNEAFALIVSTYQKQEAADHSSSTSHSQSAMSVSSVDGWLYTPSERLKASPQPTLKHSFLKLKKSMSQSKHSKSFRSIRKAVSSASLYKPQPTQKPRPSASTNTLRTSNKGGITAPHTHPDDNITDPTIETVTQYQLESVPEFDDVDEGSHKSHGICSIM